MDENINHESTRMNTNEWALQPPWLLPFGAQPTRQPCGASVLRMRGTRHAACARSRTRLFRVHWCSFVVLKRTSPAFLSRNSTKDFTDGHGFGERDIRANPMSFGNLCAAHEGPWPVGTNDNSPTFQRGLLERRRGKSQRDG